MSNLYVKKSRRPQAKPFDADTLAGKFAELLRGVRVSKNMPTREVASAAGWNDARISLIEGAKHNIQLNSLERVVRALGAQMTVTVRYTNAAGEFKSRSLTMGKVQKND